VKDTIAKAVTGAVLAGLTAWQTALADGEVTQSEWLGVAIAVLTVAGGVWAVTNKPSAKE